MRPKRLIPCLLMPPLCAFLYLLVSRTGLFARAYIALFGWDEVGPGIPYLCFPALALLTGLLPAVLLSEEKDRGIFAAWAAFFFAVFFVFEVASLTGLPADPPLFFSLWIPAVLFAFLFHLLPSWIAAALRALVRKRA